MHRAQMENREKQTQSFWVLSPTILLFQTTQPTRVMPERKALTITLVPSYIIFIYFLVSCFLYHFFFVFLLLLGRVLCCADRGRNHRQRSFVAFSLSYNNRQCIQMVSMCMCCVCVSVFFGCFLLWFSQFSYCFYYIFHRIG